MKRLSLIIQVGSSCNYKFPEKKGEGCVITKQGNAALKQLTVGFEGSWSPGAQEWQEPRNAQGAILEWAGSDSPLSPQSELSHEDTFSSANEGFSTSRTRRQ